MVREEQEHFVRAVSWSPNRLSALEEHELSEQTRAPIRDAVMLLSSVSTLLYRRYANLFLDFLYVGVPHTSPHARTKLITNF